MTRARTSLEPHQVRPDRLSPCSQARSKSRQTVREPSPSDLSTQEPKPQRHGALSIRRLGSTRALLASWQGGAECSPRISPGETASTASGAPIGLQPVFNRSSRKQPGRSDTTQRGEMTLCLLRDTFGDSPEPGKTPFFGVQVPLRHLETPAQTLMDWRRPLEDDLDRR